jgi:hypothetical protein
MSSTDHLTARLNSQARVLWKLEKWLIPDLAKLVYDYTGDGKEDVPEVGGIAMGYNECCDICLDDGRGIVFGICADKEVTVIAPECERCGDRDYPCETEFETEVHITNWICNQCIEKLQDLTEEFGGKPFVNLPQKKRTFSQLE